MQLFAWRFYNEGGGGGGGGGGGNCEQKINFKWPFS